MMPDGRKVVAGLAVAGFLAGCGGAAAPEKPPMPVKVQKVETLRRTGAARYSASIEPRERVSLAFKVSGYLREIEQRRGTDGRPRALQQGDRVARGQVLARVRQEDYVARVDRMKSEQAGAQAEREKARLDLERATSLFRSQSLTKSDYDAAQAAAAAAEARASGAAAAVEEAEIALRDCALRAPADGVVLSRSVEAGQLVSAGTVAFVLADLGSVKAVFGVPDHVVSTLSPGDSLAVETEALGLGSEGTAPGAGATAARGLRGQVTAISPSADTESRVFSVEVTIPNPEGRIKAGMIATVEVPDRAPSSGEAGPPRSVVPLAAIVRAKGSPGRYAVYVVESDGARQVARARAVDLGEVYGNTIAVLEGLAAGEQVVVTGATLLVDGEAVQVIP